MIIAWRILYLTMLAREYPDAACHIIFTDKEWKVAYMMTYRKKPPKKAINLALMVHLIAQFGVISIEKMILVPDQLQFGLVCKSYSILLRRMKFLK